MLIIPDDFLLIHVPGSGFQGFLLLHHPRGQGVVDQPVFPQGLLLASLEDQSNISFPPFLRHFFHLPWSSKDCRVLSQSHLPALSTLMGDPMAHEHSLPHPIWANGLRNVQFSLTWSFSTKVEITPKFGEGDPLILTNLNDANSFPYVSLPNFNTEYMKLHIF